MVAAAEAGDHPMGHEKRKECRQEIRGARAWHNSTWSLLLGRSVLVAMLPSPAYPVHTTYLMSLQSSPESLLISDANWPSVVADERERQSYILIITSGKMQPWLPFGKSVTPTLRLPPPHTLFASRPKTLLPLNWYRLYFEPFWRHTSP